MKQAAIYMVTAIWVAGLAACGRKSSPSPHEATTRAQESPHIPVISDTIETGPYVQFVRPLRKLAIRSDDPDDFTPYRSIDGPDTFSFVAGGERYVIAPSGTGQRRTASNIPRPFVLPVDTDLYIELLGFTRVDGDPVFLVVETDEESGAGFVVRLDSMSLAQKWKAKVPGFDLGYALRDGQYLYMTGIGSVGKLDVNSGQYAWRHDGLYAREKFNNFERPLVRGDTVEFPAGKRTLRVERQTGRRITP